jgi:hypothetical protein
MHISVYQVRCRCIFSPTPFTPTLIPPPPTLPPYPVAAPFLTLYQHIFNVGNAIMRNE